jgi:hypothetical protein
MTPKTARIGTIREVAMGSEWNKFIDNMPLRITMIVVGLAVWTLAAYGLLAVA